MLLLLRMLLMAGVVSATPPPSLAPFEQAAFDAGLKQGQATVVIVAAAWCPVCKAQERALQELAATPGLAGVKVLRLDFDAQAEAVKAFKVTSQSTILAFRHGKEVGRWVGDTNRDHIATMMKRTL